MEPDEALAVPTTDDVVALERDEELRRALGALPESLRHVVVLRLCLDYSHEEIAEALDISISASEVRLCRALKRLRQLLGATRSDTGRRDSTHRRG
jgi:RNA polymerase sigma-70 factor (ECF subfamily)